MKTIAPVLSIAALMCGVVGLLMPLPDMAGVEVLLFACLLALLARIAQAEAYHRDKDDLT